MDSITREWTDETDTPDGRIEDAQIERVSTAQLLKRYGLKSRSSLANRLLALSISPYKEGKTFYVDLEQVQKLDELNKCMSKGKTISECINDMEDGKVEVFKIQGLKNLFSEDLSIEEQDAKQSVKLEITIAPQSLQALTALTFPVQPELDRLRSLDEAARKKWLIPTSVLLSLLGLKSIPKLVDGYFCRRGFMFIKTPQRSRQAEWDVKKVIRNS